jgi:hypothetical protein
VYAGSALAVRREVWLWGPSWGTQGMGFAVQLCT